MIVGISFSIGAKAPCGGSITNFVVSVLGVGLCEGLVRMWWFGFCKAGMRRLKAFNVYFAVG